MHRISRRSVVGGALLLPFAAVGLRVATASQSSSTSTPEASPKASPEASPKASPMASPAAGGEEILVHAKDIEYDVKEIRITADTDSTITLENQGVLEHDLHIDKLDMTTKLLKPGEKDSLVVNAAAGEYDYWCTVAGHKQAGMTGKLIVE
jgi:uncharacterized cupredoxin-like copper-binding protein